MKTRLTIILASTLLTAMALIGCKNLNSLIFHPLHVVYDMHKSNERAEAVRYVLHDTTENLYWTGKEHDWSALEFASQMSYQTASKVLREMRYGETDGFAAPAIGDHEPIVIEKAEDAFAREQPCHVFYESKP